MSQMSIENLTQLSKKAAFTKQPFFCHPPQCVWKKTRKKFFHSKSGIVAYENWGQSWVMAGDPLAKSFELQVQCLEDFRAKAHLKKRSVCGYYFSKELATSSALQFHKAGVSLFQDLKNWSLQGGASEEARRALRKGEESQLSYEEWGEEKVSQHEDEIQEFSRQWTRSKGWIQIGFLLSTWKQTRAFIASGERVFICHHPQKGLQALVTIRVWQPGRVYLDQMIQGPMGARFALDFLIVKVFQQLKSEGVEEVCLGFCPGIIEKPQTWIEKILKLWSRFRILYSPKGLYHFKKKYSAREEVRYLALDHSASKILQLWNMESATLSFQKK